MISKFIFTTVKEISTGNFLRLIYKISVTLFYVIKILMLVLLVGQKMILHFCIASKVMTLVVYIVVYDVECDSPNLLPAPTRSD
jgi:hypothetical protein